MRTPAEQLKAFRQMLNITESEFSQQLGIKLSRYQKLERGDKTMNLREAIRFSRRFNVSVDYLDGIDIYPHPPFLDDEEREKWFQIFALPDQDRDEKIRAYYGKILG